MQWLLTSHVRRYHKHYGTSGHIWQGRFKSFPVQRDEHLLMVLRYVLQNPMRAGLCETVHEWPWSSVPEEGNLWIAHLWMNKLECSQSSWGTAVRRIEQVTTIRECLNRQRPFGSIGVANGNGRDVWTCKHVAPSWPAAQ